MNSPARVSVSGGHQRADGRVPCDVAPDGPVYPSRSGAARTLRKTGAGLVLAALVASCAARSLPPPDPSHPASPEAAESVPAQPATFLGQLGGTITGKKEPAPEMQHESGMMHGGGGMMQHGTGGAGHGH